MTATQNAIEQPLPITISSSSRSTDRVADVVVVLVELKGLQCSLVVLVLDSSVDDGALGKEEEVLIARGWHGQPDDIAGRSKVRF